MSDTREIFLWESPYDLEKLDDSGWNFQIAKSVAKPDGTIVYNTVWKSSGLGPTIDIVWKADYALNFAANIPTRGVAVTIGGIWQACNKGECFDLNKYGLWAPSSVPPTPDYMKVGIVEYTASGSPIHILVGVKNSDGGYDVIYMDPVPLPLNSSASYQPQETAQWWYETGQRTATIISNDVTDVETADLTKPCPDTDKYYYSTTYIYDTGTWTESEYAPPAKFYQPLYSSAAQEHSVLYWPAVQLIDFKIKIEKKNRQPLFAYLYGQWEVKYTGIFGTWQSDTKLKVTFGGPKTMEKHTEAEIGVKLGDLRDDIQAALNMAVSHTDDLPSGESWTIRPVRIIGD